MAVIMAIVWQILLLLFPFAYQVAPECEVLVSDPWPQEYLFTPQDATVQINCTTVDSTSNSHPYWAVDLPYDSSPVQSQFYNDQEELNAHGVYELSQIETPPTLRLLINDTAKNNQTKIFCSHKPSSLTLFVYQPITLVWNDVDTTINGINISWSQESSDLSVDLPGVTQAYSLTISHGSSNRVISLNESSYYFTAPEDPPLCEVYNFSVTTTYIGATYTGADCSVPSRVLSRMLPVLPDIDQVETSLSYSLSKHPERGIVLWVSFMQLAYCPNHNYILVLNGTSNESTWQHKISTPLPLQTNINDIKTATIVADNLMDNAVLTYSILITNNETEDLHTTTTGKDIYTTDLQGITIVVTQERATVEVMCDFISGSDAQGCMVVMVEESENTTVTVNLTRDDECTIKTLPLTTHPRDVFGFDIESDGSVGTISIPGTINARSDNPLCRTKRAIRITAPTLGIPWIILVTCIAVIALLLLANIGFTIVYCYVKRSLTKNKTVTGEKGEAVSYYEKPITLFPKRKSTGSSVTSCNGTYYCRTSHSNSLQLSLSHDHDDANCAAYAKLEDNKSHFYHVLERDRPPRGIKVTECSQTDPDSSPDHSSPQNTEIPSSSNASNVPPPKPKKDSASIPVYDDVILKEPQSSAVPSTTVYHPDTTPPKLPPPRGSAVRCDSETPPELPPRYSDSVVLSCIPVYADVLPKEVSKVPAGLSQTLCDPDSPHEIPLSCDGEATSFDTETPPPLPPPYRDSAVFTPDCDDVLPKEVSEVPMGLTQMLCDPDSPSETPSSCDGEATASDTETPPPLPPPYRDSALLTPVYDDVGSPANRTSTETNVIIRDFTSPFLNCGSPPPEAIPIYQDIAKISA